ncbi:MAG: hypothetical protein SH856_11305 [Flavobacteriales bacterium]|nr:hypothetical protein [Flavobacteriales bacterium]
MKKLLLVLLVLAQLTTLAQNDYTDLLEMFVDEKYEKVLYKAEKYTLSDETKKDPMPYLYMSMAFLEISKIDEMKEKYPGAFKDAIKYAGTYGKKDKEHQFYNEYEDYFSELRQVIIAEGETFMETQKYTKAKSYYATLIDIDANDAGAHIMLGRAYAALKTKKESEAEFKTAQEILTERRCSDMSKEQRGLLKEALMKEAEDKAAAGDKAKAKEWLDLGLEYFEDDKEYQVVYETSVN